MEEARAALRNLKVSILPANTQCHLWVGDSTGGERPSDEYVVLPCSMYVLTSSNGLPLGQTLIDYVIDIMDVDNYDALVGIVPGLAQEMYPNVDAVVIDTLPSIREGYYYPVISFLHEGNAVRFDPNEEDDMTDM